MESPMKRLSGKVAVVTAFTNGIGLAIATRLAQEGDKVMISSRKSELVTRALNTLKGDNLDVDGMVCHVTNKQHRTALFKETVSRFGGIDILVSTAGTSAHFGPVLDTPEDVYDKIMFDVNVKASSMLCQEAAPYMEKRGGGSIVLVSSLGAYTPLPVVGIYSVTKTALLGVCHTLAPQLASMNIRINTIAPGLIDTKMSSGITSDPGIIKQALNTIPLQRLGVPKDCAAAVAFLVSDDASYITGETIAMMGGVASRL